MTVQRTQFYSNNKNICGGGVKMQILSYLKLPYNVFIINTLYIMVTQNMIFIYNLAIAKKFFQSNRKKKNKTKKKNKI